MDRSCYRCGAPVEEHTTFCAGCGAPQIKVTLPAAVSGNQPLRPPLPPGTPDSIQPPSLPAPLPATGFIQWRKFWRIALPLSVIGGVMMVLLGLFGVVLFLVGIFIAIRRYRSDHAGPLTAAHGIRMGAASGLISYVVVLVLGMIRAASNIGEFRRQWVLSIQGSIAGNPDPNVHQFAHWAVTNQGMLVVVLVIVVFMLVLILLFSGMVGALAVALSGNKRP